MHRNQLGKYLQERFPVVNMLLFAILYAAVQSVLQRSAGSSLAFDWWDLGGILAVISFFFRLRVMDEIKDFDSDALLYPDRVLQSGRIQLSFLQKLAALGLGFELVWSATSSFYGLMAWCIALGYSLLMRYEFGLRDWLRARLVLYAISHMLIMPAVIGWLWFAAGGQWSAYLLVLMLLSVLAGFCFEIARKTHAPAAERDGVDSYSKSMGLRAAVGSIWALLGLGLVLQYWLFGQLNLSIWAFVPLPLTYLALLWRYALAMRQLRAELFREGEKLSSMYLLLSYLLLVLATWWS